MAAPPTLVHDPRTRTSNEAWVFYNPDVGKIKEFRKHDGLAVQTYTTPNCGSSESCPANSFDVTISQGITPGADPAGNAVIGDIAPAVAGETNVLACLPDWDNNVFLCFDQGVTANTGAYARAVPSKFDTASHFVRQRTENSLTLNDLHVSNWDGLQAINGVRCTIIVALTPDGSGVFSELQYYVNALITVQHMNSGSDGNASIEISGEGNFSFLAKIGDTP